MRHIEYDFPPFGPRFGGMGRPSFGCPDFTGDFPGHHGRGPGSCPFGRHGFDHSPERHGPHHHGPEHHRRGPPEDGHRGPRCGCHGSPDSDSDGPSDRHCRGRCGFRPGSDGRPYDFHRHGPYCHSFGPRSWFGRSPYRHCFGRRGPSEFPERPWGGPWGLNHPMHGFGHRGPSHPCRYNCSEGRPSRNANRQEAEPCCSGNRENQGCDKGRKENGPCFNKDKDSTGDTVFVQRIVLEKARRPQSV